MVGLHAATLVLVGQYSPSLHRAYSLFWIIGTLGAIQFPVVGLAPVKSLEQLGPAFVFLGMQVLAGAERLVKSAGATGAEAWRIRINVYAGAAAAACLAIAALAPTGYFGPLSVRVKGLFKMHTRTGNPLVDSVAEHQPSTPDAYWRYLHYLVSVAPLGFVVSAFFYAKTRDASALFLPLHAAHGAAAARYHRSRPSSCTRSHRIVAVERRACYLLDDLIDNARWARRWPRSGTG